MAELWGTMDTTAKTVVIVSALTILIGVKGFVWFMVKKTKNKG